MRRPCAGLVAVLAACAVLSTSAIAAETMRTGLVNETTGSDAEPEAIRNAVISTCGYKGVESSYCFDENGDDVRSSNIVRNENGEVTFIKHIDNSGK